MELVKYHRDFAGGPGDKTLTSKAGWSGLIAGWGTKVPHASEPKNQNVQWEQYCTKFGKDFKNGPHKKILKESCRKDEEKN